MTEETDDTADKVDVRFAKQCNYLAEDGVTYTYLPGFARIPPEHAEHWFVKAHMEDAPAPPPAEGSYEYGLQLQAAARLQKENAQLDEQQQRQLAAMREEEARRLMEQEQQRLITRNAKAALEAQKRKDAKDAPPADASDSTDAPTPTKTKGRVKLVTK